MRASSIPVLMLAIALGAADGKFQVQSESLLGEGAGGVYSAGLKHVAFGGPAQATVRSLETGQEKQVLLGPQRKVVAVSPDGRSSITPCRGSA